MIINHKYRFIYVKNARVASTSFEIALSKFCGPGDIITPISGKNERIRTQMNFTPPQNFQDPATGEKLYWAHISAREIRSKVPAEVWNDYFKFGIERNPFDRIISLFYHDGAKRKIGDTKDLRKMLEWWLSTTDRPLSNWNNYTDENGNIMLDFMLLYESLYAHTRELEHKLGLPSRIPIKRVHAAAEKRKNYTHYRQVLTEKSRDILSRACRNEIEKYGYEF